MRPTDGVQPINRKLLAGAREGETAAAVEIDRAKFSRGSRVTGNSGFIRCASDPAVMIE
jgi:hypothetical protein